LYKHIQISLKCRSKSKEGESDTLNLFDVRNGGEFNFSDPPSGSVPESNPSPEDASDITAFISILPVVPNS
jgi:hypothetical protein